MNRLRTLALVPLLLALAGCGGGGKPTKDSKVGAPTGGGPTASTPAGPKMSPAESLMKDQSDMMAELATVLESIKDDKSAEAALPKLHKLKERGMALAKKEKEIKPSPEEQKALEEKYMKGVQASIERIKTATENAVKSAPGKAKEIADALQ